MSIKKSKITKRNIIARNVFWSLSFLSNFGLIVGFFVYGLCFGVQETKYTLALVGLVGMTIALISTILKYHWRTPLIIVIGGLYFAINQFAYVLLAVAIAIVLDEMIFTPCYRHFREKASINKEIDRRV